MARLARPPGTRSRTQRMERVARTRVERLQDVAGQLVRNLPKQRHSNSKGTNGGPVAPSGHLTRIGGSGRLGMVGAAMAKRGAKARRAMGGAKLKAPNGSKEIKTHLGTVVQLGPHPPRRARAKSRTRRSSKQMDLVSSGGPRL